MQEYGQPLHADRHKGSFNFTLALALAVVVIGVLQMDAGGATFVVIGLAVAAFSWFTTPSQYTLFDDHITITYGRPRVRHIGFQQIDRSEILKIFVGDRLIIHLANGRRFLIQPRDVEGFQEKFEQALASYQRYHPRDVQPPSPPQDRDVQDAQPLSPTDDEPSPPPDQDDQPAPPTERES